MISKTLYYIALLGAIVAGYEIFRFAIKNMLITRLTRSVRRYIRQYNIKIDTFKFMSRFIVKHQLMNDADIHTAILAHARENNIHIQDVDDLVENYIDEIVPFFNLLSYYKIGYWIANFFLNKLYEVVIDRENTSKIDKIPKDAAVVFVMNHRSNVDYVLVAYMLARNISISYAVGEWARVWPLEYIFKSFGAYFLRRQYREKLYHTVLEKYIQLISLQGVTQGIFIEGGLSRDGKFRDTKVGLLDYIVKIKKNPEFNREIVFVPVGINYDWVLEDRVLIQEWKNNKERSGLRDNVSSLIRISIRGPYIILANFIRYATGRLKEHGYASVSFGDPVPVSRFLKKHPDFFKLDKYARLVTIKGFADELLKDIGGVVPVTPVCLAARAIIQIGKDSFDKSAIVAAILDISRELKKHRRRFVTGRAFKTHTRIYEHLKEEKKDRQKELVSFEEDFLDASEARNIARMALDIMRRRRFVIVRKNTITINTKYHAFIEYYSNLLS